MFRAALPFDTALLAPGRPYAERAEQTPSLPDRVAIALTDATVRPLGKLVRDPARRLRAVVASTALHEPAVRSMSDAALLETARGMRGRLRHEGFILPHVGACFAIVREAASRTLGLRHFDTQLMAGWALLQGRLIEMHTGEGKTVAATLAAAAVALAGYRMHVITVNGYLAERDAAEMAPLYAMLGISLGAVTHDTPRDERREIYTRSVVYCDNKELAFDYLRDRVAASRRGSRLHRALGKLHDAGPRGGSELTLSGLQFAIVDEADSVFIDEARTPLILSAGGGPANGDGRYERALEVARGLVAGRDYLADPAERRILLTADGSAAIAAFGGGHAQSPNGALGSARAHEEMVTQALTALALYHRDIHYVVTEGKIQIVDESTGRVMADRSWERGLHQLIEVKEGCEPTERRETLARLTYQRLFRRYVCLSGMSGTGLEVAREVRATYGLEVVRIPLHRPSQRRYARVEVHQSRAAKWDAVARVVEQLALQEGRPVLIGTRSVGASEEISAVLHARGIDHALLNAKQDGDEAATIASAGQAGRVTVATNMAGRGTDIRLPSSVAELGGLHVILTEYHDSRRVDRQLFGRCARQGNPGSCQAIVSLEDEVFLAFAPRATEAVRRWLARSGRVPDVLTQGLRWLAQESAERRGAALRAQTMEADKRMEQTLAFSGVGE